MTGKEFDKKKYDTFKEIIREFVYYAHKTMEQVRGDYQELYFKS